jgi:hypothetical protein
MQALTPVRVSPRTLARAARRSAMQRATSSTESASRTARTFFFCWVFFFLHVRTQTFLFCAASATVTVLQKKRTPEVCKPRISSSSSEPIKPVGEQSMPNCPNPACLAASPQRWPAQPRTGCWRHPWMCCACSTAQQSAAQARAVAQLQERPAHRPSAPPTWSQNPRTAASLD